MRVDSFPCPKKNHIYVYPLTVLETFSEIEARIKGKLTNTYQKMLKSTRISQSPS